MKAAQIYKFGPSDVFKIETIDIPEPNDNQVLVKMIASALNPVDYKHRIGWHKYILGSDFPIVLGYDGAGIIEKIGKNVTRFNVGDKVYFRSDKKYGGTYAEYAITSEPTLSLKPEKLSFEEAASIPLAALTALQALKEKGIINHGHRVLIIGATGGVGFFAVQLAKIFETVVTITASNRHPELLKKLSYDKIIDYTKTDFKRLPDKYDIIFDAVGVESYRNCKKNLAKKGVYITTLPRPKLAVHKILALFNGHKVKSLVMKPRGEELDFLNNLISENKFFTHIDKTFTLDDISTAHDYLETGRVAGKVVIKIS